MSYTIYFWTGLTKRNNSTLTPTTGRTEFQCIVKDGTGILNPVIQLDLGLAVDPSQFNYCQIPDFERYYWVREWTFERGLWTATCAVDVLATYKAQIGASSLYVLRAAAAYDGAVVDNLYPTKVGCSYQHTAINTPYTTGWYVIGCVSPEGTYGSITYYAISTQEMAKMCAYLITDAVSEDNHFSLTDASMALQNSLIDPMQYIKSCIYIPFAYADFSGIVTEPTRVKVFMWEPSVKVNNNTVYVSALKFTGTTITKSSTVNITKHPDTSSRGNYVNSAPYTLLTLSYPPFGVLDIDTSVSANASSLNITLRTDVITGRGILTIKCNNTVLNRVESQIGVPIQLSQVTRDYLGAATSAISGVAGSIGSLATGNIGGALSSAVSGIGNAIQAIQPRANTIGSGGGFSHLAGEFQLDHQFFRPVSDDPSHNGRPLCQVRQLSTLAGYQLIQDGDVPIPGTSTEADQVRQYLESGYYYE